MFSIYLFTYNLHIYTDTSDDKNTSGGFLSIIETSISMVNIHPIPQCHILGSLSQVIQLNVSLASFVYRVNILRRITTALYILGYPRYSGTHPAADIQWRTYPVSPNCKVYGPNPHSNKKAPPLASL